MYCTCQGLRGDDACSPKRFPPCHTHFAVGFVAAPVRESKSDSNWLEQTMTRSCNLSFVHHQRHTPTCSHLRTLAGGLAARMLPSIAPCSCSSSRCTDRMPDKSSASTASSSTGDSSWQRSYAVCRSFARVLLAVLLAYRASALHLCDSVGVEHSTHETHNSNHDHTTPQVSSVRALTLVEITTCGVYICHGALTVFQLTTHKPPS